HESHSRLSGCGVCWLTSSSQFSKEEAKGQAFSALDTTAIHNLSLRAIEHDLLYPRHIGVAAPRLEAIANGGVALYFKQQVLLEGIGWLEENGYSIYEFFCDQWTSNDIMHADLQDKM